MIRIRSTNEMVPWVLSSLALLIVLGTVLYLVLVPTPTAAGLARGKAASKHKVEQEIADAIKSSKDLNAYVDAHIWALPPQKIGPKALDQVTALAKIRKIKLVAFRPQKLNDADGLTQLPFMILVDGPFPNVMEFMKDLDKSDTKLAVSIVQMASADEASDRITATIGAAAYVKTAAPGGSSAKTL